jgi:tetratricopeptide (TPR) repeat protein
MIVSFVSRTILAVGLLVATSAVAQPAVEPSADQAFMDANDLFDQGRFEDALRLYRQALELDPEFHRARYYLAQSLEGLGRWNEALTEAKTYRQSVKNEAAMNEADALVQRLQEQVRLHRPKHLRTGPAMSVAGGSLALAGAALTTVAVLMARKTAPGSPQQETLAMVYGAGLATAASGGLLVVTGLGLSLAPTEDGLHVALGGRFP